MSRIVRVLLADRQAMFAEAMAFMLEAQEGVDVIGRVGTGEEAFQVCVTDEPDVVVIDTGLDGFHTIRRLREISPETQVIIVTSSVDGDVVARAIEAGACGYLSKDEPAERLIQMVRQVADGEIVLPSREFPDILAKLEEARKTRVEDRVRLGLLTNREMEILQAIADGKSTVEIAESLFISVSTVKTHVKSILAKLGVHSKLEAVTLAFRNGMIRLPATG
jgi:two-component system, NarL family, response regulator LiaR